MIFTPAVSCKYSYRAPLNWHLNKKTRKEPELHEQVIVVCMDSELVLEI